MELEPLVAEEVSRADFPGKVTVIVRPYPCENRADSRKIVTISIGSNGRFPEYDLSCTFLDFHYDCASRTIEDVNLKVKEELQNKGLGRKLVEVMESVGRYLGCEAVKLTMNYNRPFWAHMGYQNLDGHWEKRL